MAVLGSRSQTCIHPRVSTASSAVQSQMCRQLVSQRRCRFHQKVEGMFLAGGGRRRAKHHEDVKKDAYFKETVMDIEDLVAEGKERAVCAARCCCNGKC